jgi:hypothetical protein
MNDDQRDGRQAMLQVLSAELAVWQPASTSLQVDCIAARIGELVAQRLAFTDLPLNGANIAGAVEALQEVIISLRMRAAELHRGIADEPTADGEEEHSPTLESPPPVCPCGAMATRSARGGPSICGRSLCRELHGRGTYDADDDPTLESPPPVIWCACGVPATRSPFGRLIEASPTMRPICDAEACAERVGHALGLYERLDSLREADARLAHYGPRESSR